MGKGSNAKVAKKATKPTTKRTIPPHEKLRRRFYGLTKVGLGAFSWKDDARKAFAECSQMCTDSLIDRINELANSRGHASVTEEDVKDAVRQVLDSRTIPIYVQKVAKKKAASKRDEPSDRKSVKDGPSAAAEKSKKSKPTKQKEAKTSEKPATKKKTSKA